MMFIVFCPTSFLSGSEAVNKDMPKVLLGDGVKNSIYQFFHISFHI